MQIIIHCTVKSGTFELKSGIALEKRDLPPESGNVDTYDTSPGSVASTMSHQIKI